MKITIELFAGPSHRSVITRADINKNIAAIDRAIAGRIQVRDYALLADTKSILQGIRNKLPGGRK